MRATILATATPAAPASAASASLPAPCGAVLLHDTAEAAVGLLLPFVSAILSPRQCVVLCAAAAALVLLRAGSADTSGVCATAAGGTVILPLVCAAVANFLVCPVCAPTVLLSANPFAVLLVACAMWGTSVALGTLLLFTGPSASASLSGRGSVVVRPLALCVLSATAHVLLRGAAWVRNIDADPATLAAAVLHRSGAVGALPTPTRATGGTMDGTDEAVA